MSKLPREKEIDLICNIKEQHLQCGRPHGPVPGREDENGRRLRTKISQRLRPLRISI